MAQVKLRIIYLDTNGSRREMVIPEQESAKHIANIYNQGGQPLNISRCANGGTGR